MSEIAIDIQTIKLIDGTYDSKDAAEILYAVIDDKIKFHNIQITSSMERNDGKMEHSRQRLIELKEEKAKIAQLISEAEKNGSKLRLSARIDVDFD